jgi:predicted AlkP superfamily pyrophosphatase or phosphodiesterase
MKSKLILCLLLAIFSLPIFAQKEKKASTTLPRPKLMVGIIVDQMRWDYLYRYYDRYSNAGFKRMLNEGFTCENTYIDYSASVTAIGHATVYTGSVPAIHGITGNSITMQATGKSVNCVGDTSVSIIGSNNIDLGKASPRNLLVSTITDELRLATNFRSKVISVSAKDRGSILPGGHIPNGAYWYDGKSGKYVTSSYYMKELPNWLNVFNDKKLPEFYLKQDWNTLYPIESYVQSTEDNSKYEGKLYGSETPTFPVKTSKMIGSSYSVLTGTPYGNTVLLELAKSAIDNEKLGDDDITDFLAISFSSTDYVGHQFGPNSIEVEDTYLRLDKDLGNFFTYLDTKIGKGNYSVFLSADHAAINNIPFLIDNKIPAGLISLRSTQKTLNEYFEKEHNVKDMVINFSNNQATLNNVAIAEKKLNINQIKAKVIEELKKVDGISYVVDLENIQQANMPEYYRSRIINGYHKDRSGIIQMVQKPGWSGGGSTGTTHGTMGKYDVHIPLLFMGWGIKQGKSNNTYNMTDIAPTVSALLRIQEPNGTIGKPINEVLK